MCIPRPCQLLQEIIKDFTKIAKPLTLLTCQKAKFEWTSEHHTDFMTLKESIIQAPILHYPDPTKRYIVYMDALDDACGAQLPQKHNGTEFPIAFPSQTFTKTLWKWSISEEGRLQCILCHYQMELLPSRS